MKYWIKLLKLLACVVSLVNANIIYFLLGFPNNPHFNGVDVLCLINVQIIKRNQWKTNKWLEFTVSKDPLPFASFEFILQRKKLWRTLYKEKECRSYVDISEEKVCVHRHRLCKYLVILSASPLNGSGFRLCKLVLQHQLKMNWFNLVNNNRITIITDINP